MRNFIVGFVLGAIMFGVGSAWAAYAVLYNNQNQPVGVTGNPLYVQGV